MKSEINVFFWNKKKNFGDLLARQVMHYYGARKLNNIIDKSYSGSFIAPIGSVLHFAPREGLHVFGAGFMDPSRLGAKQAPREVITMRGPLSAKIADELGWQAPQALGDTGLLASRIYPAQRKKFKLGVVLHYSHALKTFPEIPDVVYINPLDPVRKVVRKIASCEKIISSSLHGLIVAHSFGVPWIRLDVLDRPLGGGSFKFYDFYESIGCGDSNTIQCSIFDLRNNLGSVIAEHDCYDSTNFDELDKKIIQLESAFYKSDFFDNILKPSL